ncbi:splicing factor, arginine/serine-rich 19-like [Eriocheir sinensis]|uniref:splicing factor, arginine/serine-rich 19-like n=1 Tax=Eriocheir sinensis TaxID=95602 RepID=UPI0021C90614|nr:splicing factor, arginine/serine-rich 19-like [Eriocheir sinensis]
MTLNTDFVLQTKEEEEEEEEDVEEGLIMEEEEEEEEEEEAESQEDIERLLDPNSDTTLGPFTRPPKIPPRINILWRVRLSAAEREKRERRRRLQEAREALRKKLSVASIHGGMPKGHFGPSRAGSYVSLATRQYRQRQNGHAVLTPLEAPLPEGGLMGPPPPSAARSFLPLRKSSSTSSFLAPPPYSAVGRSGGMHVRGFKPSIASKLFDRKTVTKVQPFKFHDFTSKTNHWCTMPHH